MIEAYGPLDRTGIAKAFTLNLRALGVYDHVIVDCEKPFLKGDSLFVQSTHQQLKKMSELDGFSRMGKSVAYFVWETPEIPDEFVDTLERYKAVWTASEFCAAGMRAKGLYPKVIPHCVTKYSLNPAPGEVFKFLTIFDAGSRIVRKNPFGVVSAFEAAFGKRRDVQLTIKARGLTAEYARILKGLAPTSNIKLVNQDLTEEEIDTLYCEHDALISLHQAEGFGLTLLEAMAHGMRVVYTNYSAPTEFAVGYPVDYKLEPSADDFYGQALMATPDHDSAVEQLRKCLTDDDTTRMLAFNRSLQYGFTKLIGDVGQALGDL